MKYPKILKKNILLEAKQASLILFIPKDIVYFNGHFPDAPVLPGVVQVNWAIEYATDIFNLDKNHITSINQLKFTQVILPESTVILSLNLNDQNVIFRYTNSDIVYSSGKVFF